MTSTHTMKFSIHRFFSVLTGSTRAERLANTAAVMREETMYNQVLDLLKYCPNWTISTTIHFDLFPVHDFRFAQMFPDTEQERGALLQNEGLGPIPAAYKVIRRLHTEGKVIKNLSSELVEATQRMVLYCPGQSASCFRILYHLFPKELERSKEDLASEFDKNRSWLEPCPN